jgi:hypothetical protein
MLVAEAHAEALLNAALAGSMLPEVRAALNNTPWSMLRFARFKLFFSGEIKR